MQQPNLPIIIRRLLNRTQSLVEHFMSHAASVLPAGAKKIYVGFDANGRATGVAVKAGARSAMATLWFINDRASSVLVSQFYKHLSDPSLSKAAALREAQMGLIADRFYRHPVYWSPFLMIGNWL